MLAALDFRPLTGARRDHRPTNCLSARRRTIRVMSEISQSYRYVVRSPDVRGGHARVEGTRIAVRDVIGRFGLLCLRFRVRLGYAR